MRVYILQRMENGSKVIVREGRDSQIATDEMVIYYECCERTLQEAYGLSKH